VVIRYDMKASFPPSLSLRGLDTTHSRISESRPPASSWSTSMPSDCAPLSPGSASVVSGGAEELEPAAPAWSLCHEMLEKLSWSMTAMSSTPGRQTSA